MANKNINIEDDKKMTFTSVATNGAKPTTVGKKVSTQQLLGAIQKAQTVKSQNIKQSQKSATQSYFNSLSDYQKNKRTGNDYGTDYRVGEDIHQRLYNSDGTLKDNETLSALKKSMVEGKLKANNDLSAEEKTKYYQDINRVSSAMESNTVEARQKKEAEKINVGEWFNEDGTFRDFQKENDLIDQKLNENSLLIKQFEDEINSGNLANQKAYAQLIGESAKLSGQRQKNENSLKDLDKYNKYYGMAQAKKEAFDSGDYESLDYLNALQGAEDDNVLKRMANATGKNIVSLINTGTMLGDIAKDVVGESKAKLIETRADSLYQSGQITLGEKEGMLKDAQTFREFDATNPNNMSQKIDKYISQLNEQTYYGVGDVGKVLLQALDSTENFLMQYALFGEFSTVVMGTQSAVQRTNENLKNGYDMTTSVMNGVATGTVSYLTEKIGMDNFVSLLNNKAGQFALATHLSNIANATLSQGSSEALEELVEALGDRVIDGVTHIVNDEFEVEPLDVEDIGMSMLIAFLSGGGTGAFGAMRFNLTTNQQKNQLMSDAKALEAMYQDAIAKGDNASADMYEAAIRLANAALYNYDSKTMMGDAVQFAKDNYIKNSMSLEEAQRYLEKSFDPNYNQEVNAKYEEAKAVQQIKDRISEEADNILGQKGIKYTAESFLSLSDERRTNLVALSESLQKAGVQNYRFEDIQTKNGTVVDGYFDNKTGEYVVNPNGNATVFSINTHELTHTLEKTKGTSDLTSDYLLLEGEVFRQAKAEGIDAISEINKIKERYEEAGVKQSLANCRADFVAEQIQNSIGNRSFLNKLVRYNNNVVYRLYEQSFLSKDDGVTKAFLNAFRGKFEDGEYGDVGESTFTPGDVQLSINQYDRGGREVFKKYLDSQGLSDDILTELDNRIQMIKDIADDKESFTHFWNWQDTDYISLNGENGEYTVVVKNGDYELNIDFSTVCKKRETQNAVLWELAHAGLLDRENLKQTDLVALRQIIKNHNLEVACGVCFVDSKRFRTGQWANSLIKEYTSVLNILAPKGVPINYSDYAESGREMSPNSLDTLTDEQIQKMNPKGWETVQKYAKQTTKKGLPTKRAKIAAFLLNNPSSRINLSEGDFYSAESMDNMKKGNPELYKIVYAWGGQSKPKTPFAALSYDNTIVTNNKFNFDVASAMGGMRLQSFSDYQANMVVDYLQMFAEISAKGLPVQAYTKVEDFVRLFGMTGAKINMSIINLATDKTPDQVANLLKDKKANQKREIQDQYAGLKYYTEKDVNDMSPEMRKDLEDNYGLSKSIEHDGYTAYLIDERRDSNGRDISESYNWRRAIELQNDPRYAGNVGTIVIGFGREHILKLLADNNVKMVIPYHKSGINATVAKMMNLAMIRDFTNDQTTKDAEGNTVPAKKDFKFYESLRRTGDARATASEYLAWCRERGYTPKFEEFSDNPNYYKVLVDFNTYSDENNTVPAMQNPVQFNFPEEFGDIVRNSLVEYEQDQDIKDVERPKIVEEYTDYLKNSERNLAAVTKLAEDGGVQYSIGGNGYDGWSMSNNAREAYDEGRKPLSQFDSMDLADFNDYLNENGYDFRVKSLRAFKDLLSSYGNTGEWHHTSSYYNETSFYDPSGIIDAIEDGTLTKEKVEEFNKSTPKEKGPVLKWKGDFNYIEWSGTKSHPRADHIRLKDVIVEEKGSFYTVYDKNGKKIVKKKKSANGVDFINKGAYDSQTAEYVNERKKTSPVVNEVAPTESTGTNEAYREEQRKIHEQIISNSDGGFKEFADDYSNGNYESSMSGNIYPVGKKPSPSDYENLSEFYKVGDRRYVKNGARYFDGYRTEVWNGKKFIPQENYGRSVSSNSVTVQPDIFATVIQDSVTKEVMNGITDRFYDPRPAIRNSWLSKYADTSKYLDDVYKDVANNILQNSNSDVEAINEVLGNLAETEKAEFLKDFKEETGLNADNISNVNYGRPDIQFSISETEKIIGNLEDAPEVDKAIENMVNSDPISKKQMETISRYRAELSDSIQKWYPDYKVLKDKYKNYIQFGSQEEVFKRAMFDIVSEGEIRNDTRQELKEVLKGYAYESYGQPQMGERTNLEVETAIEDMTMDAIRLFESDAKYQTNKRYMDSVAGITNKMDEAFTNGTMSDEEYLAEYDKVANAKNLKGKIKEARQNVRDNNIPWLGTLFEVGKNHNNAFQTREQILDVVSNGNGYLRQDLNQYIELPFHEAQKSYTQRIAEGRKLIAEVIDDTGIVAGSPESFAITYLMEEKIGDTPYTLVNLKEDFDYEMENGKKAWENIETAAKRFREFYDARHFAINDQRINQIYGDIEENARVKLSDAAAKYKYALQEERQAIARLKQNPNSPELQASLNRAERTLRTRLEAYNQLVKDIDSGDEFRRQLLLYKKKFTHHTKNKSLAQTLNTLFGKGEAKVTNELAGKSQDVKPRSTFAKFFLKQTGGNLDINDAITNMADYIMESSRVIAFDPYIDYMRTLTQDVRNHDPKGTEMGHFITWLERYTNDLVGKRAGLDREVDNLGEGTQNFRDIIKKLSSRAKNAALTGNIRSALVQFGNIPNGLAVLTRDNDIEGLKDAAKGVAAYFSNRGKEIRVDMLSPFLNARYNTDIDIGKKGLKQTIKNITDTMLTFGDEISTKMIWYAGLEQAHRNMAVDKIAYADDIARRAVAGRSIGEVPLFMKTTLASLLFPFQVEVNNQWQTTKQSIKTKDWVPLVSLEASVFLANGIFEAILNDRVIEGDFINAILEGLKRYEDDDDDTYIYTYVLGEAISMLPGASTIAAFSGLNDIAENKVKDLFGDSDFSRYGAGNIAVENLVGAVVDGIQGNYLDVASDLFGTYGNRQIQRSIGGLQALGYLPSYQGEQSAGNHGINIPGYLDPQNWKRTAAYKSGSGRLGFVTNNEVHSLGDLANVLKTIAFGKWASKEAQDYIKGGFKTLGTKQTETFDQLVNDGTKEFDAFQMIKDINNKVKDIKADDDHNNKAQLISSLGETDYDYKELNTLYDQQYGKSKYNERVNTIAESNGWDDETRYNVKVASSIESLKDKNGETIKNSRALQVREEYEKLGVYEDILKYIESNGLKYGDFNLNKTVVGYSSDKFRSEYKAIVGKDSESGSNIKGTSKSSSKRGKGGGKSKTVSKSMNSIDILKNGKLAKRSQSDIKSEIAKIRKASDSRLAGLIREFKKNNPGTTLFD